MRCWGLIPSKLHFYQQTPVLLTRQLCAETGAHSSRSELHPAVHRTPQSASHPREVNPNPSHPVPSHPLNHAAALKCIKHRQPPSPPATCAPQPLGAAAPVPPQRPASHSGAPSAQKGRSLRQIYGRSLAGRADRGTDGHCPIAALSCCFAFLTYFPNYSTAAGSHRGLPALWHALIYLSAGITAPSTPFSSENSIFIHFSALPD